MSVIGHSAPVVARASASAALVAVILALSSSFAMGVGPALAEDLQGGTDGGPSASPSMRSHVATQEDIDNLKAMFGVRQAGDAYEAVTVDGFGTGLVPNTEEDWQRLVGELVIFEADAVLADLPGSFDLSVDPEFPIVGNQAAQGSCSAWAGTYYSYGYLEALDNGWTGASEGVTDQLMSPAWTYNMVNGGKDQGSWIDTNMMVVRDWGAATMAEMPYSDDDATSWGSPEAFREAPLHRASEVGYLVYSPVTTVEAIKALIVAGTPVAFAMDANEYTSGFEDDNYIISSSEYSSTSLNHAQTLVGFDDSLSDDGDHGAFRVVNSWGADWGDSGYYWMTYSAIEELGDLDLLNLNFIVDIPDYEPSLLGVWHFDAAPSRAASISIGVGSTPAPENTKTPYYDGGLFSTMQEFPTFMCLDMTEHSSAFWSGGEMSLSIGDSRTNGVISSFRVEGYQAPYVPGRASQLGGQSLDVPSSTPGSAVAHLEYYDAIAIGDALESVVLDWSSDGQASWTGVDHHSSADVDSLQTGDVSDGAYSRLETSVEGPVEVSFDWKVSSESGADLLGFYIDGSVYDSISGEVDWEAVSATLSEGSHTLTWQYSKDGYASVADDSGWLDSVTVTGYVPGPNQPPTIASLTVSPDASHVLPGTTVTFQVQVEDDEGGTLSVEALYGDGALAEVSTLYAVSAGETVSFWFNHTYAEASDDPYTASFASMDGDDHDPVVWDEESAEVLVNTPPTAVLAADPEEASTGQVVSFDASGSSDPETDHASLQYRWDWEGDGTWDTTWSSSSGVSHSFSFPGDYEVTVQVMDDAGLASEGSVTVSVTGEAIPEFSALLIPVLATLLAVIIIRGSRRGRH